MNHDPIHQLNQHIISVAAVVVPTASLWIKLAPVITDVAGAMGIAWYLYLGYKEFLKWKRRHHNGW